MEVLLCIRTHYIVQIYLLSSPDANEMCTITINPIQHIIVSILSILRFYYLLVINI